MLRITAMKSEKYFTEGLQKADYYRDQVILDPVWVGELADKLGIAGINVTSTNFTQLFNNINPATGLQVTPIMAKDRKPYYDFTFSAPKSVSILWTTTENIALHDAISKAFDESVKESITFAEKQFSLARDKRGGGNVYNTTENLLYSFFRHDTARPVGGIADPHIHTHCTVFNMTFDPVVGKFKAMEFHDFAKYRNQIEAYHHSTLAKKLQELGIEIVNTYNSFEIAGFNRELIEKFSNRTKIIKEYVRDNDILSSTQKGEAGRRTREKKHSQELSREQSKENWISRFSSSELIVLRDIETSFSRGDKIVREDTEESSKTAVEQSISHFLERDTMIDQNAVITFAMNSNLIGIDYDDVTKVLDSKLQNKEVIVSNNYQDSSKLIDGKFNNETVNHNVRGGNRVEFLTTPAVIEMENEIIRSIESSTGNYKPINSKYQLEASMSVDQDRVFYEVLKSKNSIDVIKGKPGSGKTYLLKELKKAIEASDKTLYAYAPTSVAGRKVLREEVTEYANTVQYLFTSQDEQAKLNSKSVVIIDEAGLLSYTDTLQLMKLQSEKGFKLINVGDINQNSPVNSGSGLKVIEFKTKLKAFRLDEIRRQNPNPIYKKAIEHLTSSEIKEGYEVLDNAGYILEIKSKKDRNKLLSDKYVEFVLQDKLIKDNQDSQKQLNKAQIKQSKELLGKYSTNDVLALSASVIEVKELNRNIRQEMIKTGLVGKDNIDVPILVDKKYTLAEKQNSLIYKAGDIIVPTQNTKDLKIGKEYKVFLDDKDKDKPKITIYKSDKENPKKRIREIIDVPVQEAKSFNVNSQEKLKLAEGDTITLTLNGKSETGTRLLKEARHQVKSIELDPKTKKLKITLENNQVLKSDFKYLNYGYATTNYKSQGQTVKNVLISQSELAYPASGRQSLKVACSRATHSVLIATDDKKALKKSFHLDRSKKIADDLGKKINTKPVFKLGI